ncbi:uncharacterized protein SAPINGB_P000773 [Magnusiomyces paraingens]|uniref:Vacuolar-sorting protein SNF7 n=1 Tax=Magnusiomyces paraingens TaxID=2606893 RepID=A0A5E8B8C5_9ASCO|nr:uncharacterized protein SAPINGB_P000773 [Saprochaete ingens]VVT45507.1 unnamed protein product [Saprochaete ingens]
MSGLFSMFFGNNDAKKDTPKKAIADLRMQITLLQKKEDYLTKQIEEQENLARKNVTTNKNLARTALRRKKMHEKNLEGLQGQIDSLESQLNAIESANLNFETMKAMKQGSKALKHIHGNMNIDKVDQTMDEIEEQVTLGQEINNAISRPLAGLEMDDDELNDELENLEQEVLEEKMVVGAGRAPVAIPGGVSSSTTNIPATKNAATPAKKEEEDSDEEEELRRLQAEMAL